LGQIRLTISALRLGWVDGGALLRDWRFYGIGAVIYVPLVGVLFRGMQIKQEQRLLAEDLV